MPQGILNDIVGDGEPRLESEPEGRFGSGSEVSRGPGNVRFRGFSGSRFRVAGGLLVANIGLRRVETQGSAPGAEESRYTVPSVLELQAGQRPTCVLASDVTVPRHIFNQGPVIRIVDQWCLVRQQTRLNPHLLECRSVSCRTGQANRQ